jgi:phosphate/phosphite/phosphonate ABC transporter binding protein
VSGRARLTGFALLFLAGCFSQPESFTPAPRPAASRDPHFKLPPGIDKVRFGLVPHLSPDRMRATRSALAAYLSQGLGVPVELVIGADYDDVGERMSRGEIDIAEFSPFAFVRARRKTRLRVLASAIQSGSATSGGYIIVRDDSPRKTIDDLRGARFGFVDPASTSGFLYPMKLFKDRGIDPATFFASTTFMGSHDGVLLGILDGGIEAGATWQGSFSALKVEKGIDPLEFRVIAKMPRTPQDVLCIRESGSRELGDAITQLALRLNMREKSTRDILSAMSINGYVPADASVYDQVERIALELDAGEP